MKIRNSERYLQHLDSAVAVIGKLFRSMPDSPDLLFRLSGKFADAGYRTVTVAPEEINGLPDSYSYPRGLSGGGLPWEEVILELNAFFSGLERDLVPDLFLVQLPGGLIRYSDICCEDFGIYSFALTQAVPPDYFILDMPVMEPSFFSPGSFGSFRKLCRYRFSLAPDAVLMENLAVQDADSFEEEQLILSRTDPESVRSCLEAGRQAQPSLLMLEHDGPETPGRLADGCIRTLTASYETF